MARSVSSVRRSSSVAIGGIVLQNSSLRHAVRGNVDHGAWSANLLVTQRIEIDGFRIYVLHILAELDPQPFFVSILGWCE